MIQVIIGKATNELYLLRPYISVSECKTGKRYLEDNKKEN